MGDIPAVKNDGTIVGTAKYFDFHPGSNISITTTYDLVNLEADLTIAATGTAAAPHADQKSFYCATWGSASNDGLTWNTPKSTIADVIALSVANGSEGDIYFSAGNFAWTDTVLLGQSVRLHGVQAESSAGHGTEWTWSGPDDGRHGILTSPGTDWSHGLIENIRFVGPGNMTGGGSCISLENPQNAFIVRNCTMSGFNSGAGIHLWDSAASVNYPGYGILEQVWSNTNLYPFLIESGTTTLTFIEIASDPGNSATKAPVTIRMKNNGASVSIADCSQSGATVTMNTSTAHGGAVGGFVEITGVDVAGYNGIFRIASVPDTDTLTYTHDRTGLGAGTGGTLQKKHDGTRCILNFFGGKIEAGTSNVPHFQIDSNAIVNIHGFSARNTGAVTTATIQWDGPRVDANNNLLIVPPLTVTGMHCQSRGTLLAAPRFGSDAGDYAITATPTGGGRAIPFSFFPSTTYGSVMRLRELPDDPAAAPTNEALLYCRDNGSAKTQIVARFPTGAVQVIATEPA